jgi:gamma-glutamyltranspeptidase/glutathione hydrolase
MRARLPRDGRVGRRAAAIWLCAAAAACGGAPDVGPVAEFGMVARASGGMVVSGSEPATRAGVSILEQGGNAVDAAVASAFALAVAEPTQSGLGGRTQALVRLPDGRAFGIDATTSVPRSYDPDAAADAEDGYAVIAVPGTVAGLGHLLEEAGSLPLDRVLEPAIRLAETGFPLSEGEAARLASVRDRIVLHDAARSVFLAPDETPYEPGDTLRQPDLAGVLRAIAQDGPRVFYEGWVGSRIAEDLARNGSWVTAEDLATYAAAPSIVVRGRFGDLDLVGSYIPASGATTIEALQILDRVPLGSLDPDARALAVGRALLMAFDDRETAWNDERAPVDDAAWITSAERALERATELVGGAPDDSGGPGGGEDGSVRPEAAHTTHLSVVDARGMAVALTQSLGPTAGSRVVTPGLGFLYATTLGGYLGPLQPGDRPWSSQSPLIAEQGGRTAYVMGGAGARRIISALVQTLVRVEADGLPVEEALAEPRFHPSTSGWIFEQTEDAVEPRGASAARRAGYEVVVRPAGTYFARLNVIRIDPDGRMTGAADPRWIWGAASGPVR